MHAEGKEQYTGMKPDTTGKQKSVRNLAKKMNATEFPVKTDTNDLVAVDDDDDVTMAENGSTLPLNSMSSFTVIKEIETTI